MKKKKKKEIEWKYLALIQLWLYFNLDLCILDFIENRKKNDYLKPFYFSGFIFATGKASSMTSMIFHFNSGTF